jgi:Mycothiol maleylpyruvate isomerase N-terminal domain
MGEIDGFRQRVEAARREYAALPREGWGEPGPLDERTGERWDRGNVLGHVAEMVPFWTVQVRAAVFEGSEEIGRDAVGMAQRRMGIDSGREAGEDGLLDRIDQGLADLDAVLASFSDADLERPLRFRVSGTDRTEPLRYGLEHLLVGHLEEHLGQLRALDG